MNQKRLLACLVITALVIIGVGFWPSRKVKGNGSSMIYHLPGCSSYAATVIGNDPDDAWFASEDEAKANGFRKAKNCP